jgi:hypothetical protein
MPYCGDMAAREHRVSHFIPSVELTGSRHDQIGKLDVLIRHLQQVRRALGGDMPGISSERGRNGAHPWWQWFAAGIMVGAVFALLIHERLTVFLRGIGL